VTFELGHLVCVRVAQPVAWTASHRTDSGVHVERDSTGRCGSVGRFGQIPVNWAPKGGSSDLSGPTGSTALSRPGGPAGSALGHWEGDKRTGRAERWKLPLPQRGQCCHRGVWRRCRGRQSRRSATAGGLRWCQTCSTTTLAIRLAVVPIALESTATPATSGSTRRTPTVPTAAAGA